MDVAGTVISLECHTNEVKAMASLSHSVTSLGDTAMVITLTSAGLQKVLMLKRKSSSFKRRQTQSYDVDQWQKKGWASRYLPQPREK